MHQTCTAFLEAHPAGASPRSRIATVKETVAFVAAARVVKARAHTSPFRSIVSCITLQPLNPWTL